jgi:hypothetical protein
LNKSKLTNSYQAPKGNVNRARFAFDVLVGVLDRDVGDPVSFIFITSSSVPL